METYNVEIVKRCTFIVDADSFENATIIAEREFAKEDAKGGIPPDLYRLESVPEGEGIDLRSPYQQRQWEPDGLDLHPRVPGGPEPWGR